MPPTTKLYRDTDDVKLAARNMGSHFFDADTMRFFGSRIGERVYGGRFFVTSEQREWNTPRRYTVRVVTPSGRGRRFDITTAGDFHSIDTGAEARRLAERLARGPFEVRNDPYENVAEQRAKDAAELAELRAAFDAAGGRGVEMADRIDELNEAVDPNPRHYEWRVYAGDVPIGIRTTRAAARSMRADLERAARAAGTYGKGKR